MFVGVGESEGVFTDGPRQSQIIVAECHHDGTWMWIAWEEKTKEEYKGPRDAFSAISPSPFAHYPSHSSPPHNSQARTMPHPESKKRAFSEIVDDERDAVKSKKPKVESDADPDQSLVFQDNKPKNKGKDGKKRRRRSKSKKQPITAGASRTVSSSL